MNSNISTTTTRVIIFSLMIIVFFIGMSMQYIIPFIQSDGALVHQTQSSIPNLQTPIKIVDPYYLQGDLNSIYTSNSPFPYRKYEVIQSANYSDSMRPSIPMSSYSIVTYNFTYAEAMQVGNIIVFDEDTTNKIAISHRIVKIDYDEYKWWDILHFFPETLASPIIHTKGDNNWFEDEKTLRYEDIVGLVVGVIY